MSFDVLVIPEDATHDHYVLKPVVKALVAAAGKPRAVVQVVTDPAAHGVDQVLDMVFLQRVVRRYPMTDVFLLCVDRDGKPGREQELAHRERELTGLLGASQSLFGTAAHQEVEAWCLAGMDDLPLEWSWQQVRAEPHCKEKYFQSLAQERGVAGGPGEGREVLVDRRG